MTASENNLKSLRNSTERMLGSVTMIGAKVLSDRRITGPTQKVQSELRQAKALGQLTVLTATSKLKKTLSTESSATKDLAGVIVEANKKTEVTPPTSIPDYVNLSASQIIPLVRALDDNERAEILAYESATRQRKTILAALQKPAE